MAEYNEDNIIGLFEDIGKASGQDIRKEKDFSAILTHESAWPNIIYNLQFRINDLHERIKQLQNEIEKGVCPKILMTNPGTSGNVLRKLEELNLKTSRWTAMTIDLNKRIQVKLIKDFKIHAIENVEQMNLWYSIVQKELMANRPLNQRVFNKLLGNNKIKFYLGWINNKPVSTAMSFTLGDSVGVYLVATHSAYRRKGIGKQMTIRVLNDAIENGCLKGMLQATDLGIPVYKSIGFLNKGEIKVFNLKKNYT